MKMVCRQTGFLLLLLAFAVFSFWVMNGAAVLGVNYDEAMTCYNAMELLDSLKAGDFAELNPVNWMLDEYAGRVKELMLLPVFVLFEAGAWWMRMAWCFYALIGMGAVFFVVRRLFGFWEGILTVCLLALNSNFVRAVRLNGFREEPFMLFWLWLALVCFIKSSNAKRKSWFFAAFLLLGIGFWTKVMFAGYLVGFIVVAVCFRKNARFLWAKVSNVWLAVIAFVAGMLPFLLGNVFAHTGSFRLVVKAFSGANRHGRSNLDVVQNFGQRIYDLGALLLGGLQLDHFSAGIHDYLWLLLFGVACVYFLVCFFRRRATGDLLIVAFLVFYAVVFGLSIFVPVLHSPDQLLVLLPLPELVVAVFAVRMFSFRKKLVGAFVLCALLVHVSVGQITLWRLSKAIRQRQMYQDFSAVLGDTCDYIFEIGMQEKVICLSNWVFPRIEVVTNGGIRTLVPWFVGRSEFENTSKSRLDVFYERFLAGRSDFCLLVMSPFEQLDEFSTLLTDNGFVIEELKAFEYPNCVNSSKLFKVSAKTK